MFAFPLPEPSRAPARMAGHPTPIIACKPPWFPTRNRSSNRHSSRPGGTHRPIRVKKIYDCSIGSAAGRAEFGQRAVGDNLKEFFKKPWWVGPLVAAVAYWHPGIKRHHHESDVTGSVQASITSSYLRIDKSAPLPRYGSVVVAALCPNGRRLIGGGYELPSALATASSSRQEAMNAWQVKFKSYGGTGEAKVHAICSNR